MYINVVFLFFIYKIYSYLFTKVGFPVISGINRFIIEREIGRLKNNLNFNLSADVPGKKRKQNIVTSNIFLGTQIQE